jgi:RHS repeat-associated protein
LVQSEYIYEPFGKTTGSGAASTNAFKYTGREDDGTGLYYYRARYYHPSLQRFISEDPIGFAGGDVNLYAYVFNDPVNLIDPSGHNAMAGAIPAGGAAGAAVCGPPCAVVGAGLVTVGIVGWCIWDYVSQSKDSNDAKPPYSVYHPSDKRARDAAKKDGKGTPVRDPDHGDGRGPHYHPTNSKGERMKGPHHRFPG